MFTDKVISWINKHLFLLGFVALFSGVAIGVNIGAALFIGGSILMTTAVIRHVIED